MQKIVQFLSNHFEQIMAVNLYLLISIVVMMVAVRVRYIRFKQVQEFLQQIVFYGIIVGESVLVIVTIYIFTINLSKKEDLAPDFSASISSTTDWVKDDLTVYFINEKTLVSVKSDGSGRRDVFKAPDNIREYHFSPDGKYILVVTKSDLFQYDLKGQSSVWVDSLQSAKSGGFKGVINGIAWAPTSRKYCYRVARWTQYSSLDTWYIYDIKTKEKKSVRNPARKINYLVWDSKGQNLYYSWFDALDTAVRGNPYEVKVYEVSLSDLKLRMINKFPFQTASLSSDDWIMHGIKLFDLEGKRSFGRAGKKDYSLRSARGSRIGIDKGDHLYYIRHRWWKKRLYKIPRVPAESDISRYQYRGGRLAVQDLRWLPSGRYVIMEHYFFGILILDPSSGEIGILANERGNTFGWYTP